MATFRKKPVEIEAVRVADALHAAGHAWAELPTWLADAYEEGKILFLPNVVEIVTLEGRMTGQRADWIISGVQGELYPCKPDIFAATYETPAPAAELTEAQRLAEGIICELVSEAEFGDIGDRLEDHAEGLAAIDFDQLRRNVADLISKATVTVTWPQDAEQAGGDQ